MDFYAEIPYEDNAYQSDFSGISTDVNSENDSVSVQPNSSSTASSGENSQVSTEIKQPAISKSNVESKGKSESNSTAKTNKKKVNNSVKRRIRVVTKTPEKIVGQKQGNWNFDLLSFGLGVVCGIICYKMFKSITGRKRTPIQG